MYTKAVLTFLAVAVALLGASLWRLGSAVEARTAAAERLSGREAEPPRQDGERLRRTNEVRARLARKVPQVRIEGESLGQALDALAADAGVNLVVHRGLLADNGVDLEAPVTLRMKDGTFAAAFRAVLGQAAPRFRLDYTVYDGMVVVTSESAYRPYEVVRFYDVSDVIAGWAAAAATDTASAGKAGAAELRSRARDLLVTYLLDRLGRVGNAEAWGTVLVVTQTPERHAEVEHMLAEVRREMGRTRAAPGGTAGPT